MPFDFTNNLSSVNKMPTVAPFQQQPQPPSDFPGGGLFPSSMRTQPMTSQFGSSAPKGFPQYQEINQDTGSFNFGRNNNDYRSFYELLNGLRSQNGWPGPQFSQNNDGSSNARQVMADALRKRFSAPAF